MRVSDGKPPLGNSATLSSRGYLHSDSVIRSNDPKQDAGARVPEIQESLPTKETETTSFKPLSSSEQIVQNAPNGTQDAPGAAMSGKFSTGPIPPEKGKAVHEMKKSGTRPRTFHLSASTKSLSSPSMVSMHGIKKSGRRRHDLAVFEEKIKIAMDPSVVKAGSQKGTELSGQGAGIPLGVEGNHSNSRVSPAVSAGGEIPITEYLPEAPDGDESIPRPQQIDEVPSYLSQAALQANQAPKIIDSQLQPQLKFQPKPPKPRCKENPLFATGSSPGGVSPDAQNPESQDDFVYDTYLRTKQPTVAFPPDCPMKMDQLGCIADGKVGILVIAEQDEAVWETYAEEEESDKDWNSEEEDENGTFFIPSERVSKQANGSRQRRISTEMTIQKTKWIPTTSMVEMHTSIGAMHPMTRSSKTGIIGVTRRTGQRIHGSMSLGKLNEMPLRIMRQVAEIKVQITSYPPQSNAIDEQA